ncbi:MAG: four-carbon acid sugar kinase family protein [Beutenbergiaceae bacterium]
MKTLVLDDDPTGTQAAADVAVVLEPQGQAVVAVLEAEPAVYVQTNSRAIDAQAAVARVTAIREAVAGYSARSGEQVRVVLRGDSTLRGHVFAETDAIAPADAVIVFAPAFPGGGRVTVDGVHYVEVDGVRVPAAQSEYADDPVFPFTSSALVDYVAEKSGHQALSVPLAQVRAGQFAHALQSAAPGTVLLPDLEHDSDATLIAHGIMAAEAAGVTVVVRCAAPLAAELAGVRSSGSLTAEQLPTSRRALVVCGSHTTGATSQLQVLAERGGPALEISTEAVFSDPAAEVARVLQAAREHLLAGRTPMISTERHRRPEHDTLAHGEAVMRCLIAVTRHLVPEVDVIVSKGGITASEVASTAIGATTARVLGQVLAGVSVWRMSTDAGSPILQVIVPGNVGGPTAIRDALAAICPSGQG